MDLLITAIYGSVFLQTFRLLKEAKLRKYYYVIGYVYRTIINRLNRGEAIEPVQKYDPD
ncbi:MAG: hypothetical protein ACRD8W_04520 [Nitrososphaeraceae archaeon]